MTAYTVRLGFGLLAIALVAGFPSQTPIPYAYFLLVIGFTVLGSFTRYATQSSRLEAMSDLSRSADLPSLLASSLPARCNLSASRLSIRRSQTQSLAERT